MVGLRTRAPRVFSSNDESATDAPTATTSNNRPKRASAICRKPIIDISSDEEGLEYDHEEVVTNTRINTGGTGARSGSRFVIDRVEG